MKSFLKVVFGSCLGVILASVIVFIIFFSMLGAAVGGVMGAFNGEKETKKVKAESVLLLDMNGVVTDTSVENPFDFLSKEVRKNYTLPEILKALEVARENSDIEAVVLKLENTGLNFATAKELRDALKRFQESGKEVIAYSDNYSFLNYYVSSVADQVIGGPEGSLNIIGLTSSTVFTKGLLQKLGVEMQVFKVGTFKGAVEPYILDGLSPANRLQIEEYLQGLWQGTTTEMAVSRGVDASVFQQFADNVHFMDKLDVAEQLGLIDTLVYRVDLDQTLAERLFGDSEYEMDYLHVEDLLPLYDSGSGSDEVAVIYAEGNIVIGTGEDSDDLWSSERVITERVVKQLREAAEDDDVKAVVLRVNSGGGAVTTSELICHELAQLKNDKPVVVSMGDYAASGGYYISSHASAIVANPYTLTGSIGIFGIIPNAEGTMKKLGLKEEQVSTSTAGSLSVTKPLSPRVAGKLQEMIERGYDQFITRVATGRDLSKETVDSIGQGRVWLGAKAIELGLVDQLGGLDVAIQEAARLAELDSYTVVESKEKVDWLQKIFGINVGASVQTLYEYFTLTNEEKLYRRTEQYIKQMSGVKALPPYDLTRVGATACETTQTTIGMM